MRIGLLGCGAIGRAVADAVLTGDLPGIRISVIMTHTTAPAQATALNAHWTTQIEDVLASDAEVILEVAGVATLRQHALRIVQHGKHLMLMSAAALVDGPFRQQLITEATHHQCEVIVAAGAIGGLDVLRAARQRGALDEVIYTSTKHPRSLMGAPYLEANGIDISQLASPQMLYEGPAGEVMLAFPQNVNVAAAVSLAGIGFERTRVRIIADPVAQRTTHALLARGDFGILQLQIDSSPHPDNPRTSYLACLGAISALAYRQSPFKVGG